MKREQHNKLLIVACLLALMIADVVVWAFLYPKFSSIGTDGVIYATLGYNIATGQGLTLYGQPHTVFSPLFPAVSAVAVWITGNAELAIHLATMLFALLTIPALYIVIAGVSGRRAGLIAAVLWAFNGTLVWYAMDSPVAQIPAAFFTIVLWGLLDRSLRAFEEKRGWMNWLFLGAVLGLSYLTRPEYIFLVPLGIFVLAFRLRRRWRSGAFGKSLTGLVFGFLVIAGPYLLFLHNELGRWAISGRENEAAMIVTADDYEKVDSTDGSIQTAVVKPPELSGGMLAQLEGNTGAVVKRFLKGLRDNERTFSRSFGVFGLALVGLGVHRLLKIRRGAFLFSALYVFSPMIAIALVIIGGKPDYLIQLYPVLVGIAAIGVLQFAGDISEYFGFRSGAWPSVLVTAALVPYFFFPVVQGYLFLPSDIRPEEQRQLGVWMRENLSDVKDALIVARKPNVAFYAEGRFALVPDGVGVKELVSSMREAGARYLVADTRFLLPLRPMLKDLVVGTPVPKQFELIHAEEYRGQRALLYRLNTK